MMVLSKKNLFLVPALAAALFAAGCSLDNFANPGSETAEADAPPPGTVWVSVKLPAKVPQKSFRSLDAAHSEAIIDYYEIYLRDRGLSTNSSFPPPSDTDPIYFGTAREGEVLRLSVPPNHNYDVLLLGGRFENMILLASAFVNSESGGSQTYAAGGTGIAIKPDITNTISLTLEWIASNPVTHYTLDDGASPTIAQGTAYPYTDILYTTLKPQSSSNPGELETTGETEISVVVTTEGIDNLTFADDSFEAGAFERPNYVKARMKIVGYSSSHPVPTMSATYDQTNNSASIDDMTGVVTYTFKLGSGENAEHWPAPSVGVYARMYYELNYYAFGRDPDTAKGSKWNIRNNYDPRLLDTGPGSQGGSILLIIGTDPGDFIPYSDVQIGFE
ncbi:MAG: hypothetical protein LBG76_05335 [Treponema sp.]|jgi:hypothetical protein|nr:hypothetical protein [Treponema sp.]